jgi:hypothetical protein
MQDDGKCDAYIRCGCSSCVTRIYVSTVDVRIEPDVGLDRIDLKNFTMQKYVNQTHEMPFGYL